MKENKVADCRKKLACIILNYNDASTVISLVKLIETYSVIDYIVIVDNMSTDSSFEKLKELQTENIFVISSEKNGGYGYGNNYGIKYAKNILKADYALIANPDTKFEEKVIIGLKNLIMKYPKCIITAPEYVNGKSKTAWKILRVGRYILESSSLFFIVFGRKDLYSKAELKKRNYVVDVVAGALLLIDIDKFIEIGMYDEDIFLYEEEIIIGTKAKKYHYETRLLPKGNYQHIHSVTISKVYSSITKQRRMILDSRLIYLKKYRDISGIRLKLTQLYFNLVCLETKCIQIAVKNGIYKPKTKL